MSDPVITRFAPSPTGTLHIGGARTALFNWLFARANGGQFLLRIEDTDKARSTPEATQAIFNGLHWLGLDHDGNAVSQASRADRHAEVANAMLAQGDAYKCFATPDEITSFRDAAKEEKRSTLFLSPWRDADPSTFPDAPFVVRLKAPRDGVTVITDQVQGDVTIRNDQLDDMVLLRSDGTPVYMLAVVVDDHDMGVTHVIRGDDHLNNAARQMQIYHAMDWDLPTYAHIPLIHGPDGKKMSKRHGATGVEEYQTLGYPAAGMRNYLARLGWSHGDDEFFTDAQAQEWFGLDSIVKSPARFDFKKLENLCGQHIAVMEDADLVAQIQEFLAATAQSPLPPEKVTALNTAAYCLKERAKTFPELIDKAAFVLKDRPIEPDEKAAKALTDDAKSLLRELTPHLQTVTWSRDELVESMASFADAHGTKFGKLAGPLRAVLAGAAVTPSVYDMMLVLGREETVARIRDVAPN